MMGGRTGLLALLTLPASAAMAQEGGAAISDATHAAAPVDESRSPDRLPAVWVAGLSGGLLQRDGGSQAPYATLSLTRYKGHGYIRGAFTVYRSTLQELDAARPSTYYVGSLGAGGNWNDWVVDAFASYGRQHYGLVETMAGQRESEIGTGSDYVAAGLRAGRIFRPAPRWFLTPTLGVQYADTQSLRHGIAMAAERPEDFQLRERAWTGNASIRIDRALGAREQHLLGLSLTHYQSSNGLTAWRLGTGSGMGPGSARATPAPIPDGWEELGLSASWQVSRRLCIDNQIQRTVGAVAGDSTTVTVGLRLRM